MSQTLFIISIITYKCTDTSELLKGNRTDDTCRPQIVQSVQIFPSALPSPFGCCVNIYIYISKTKKYFFCSASSLSFHGLSHVDSLFTKEQPPPSPPKTTKLASDVFDTFATQALMWAFLMMSRNQTAGHKMAAFRVTSL